LFLSPKKRKTLPQLRQAKGITGALIFKALPQGRFQYMLVEARNFLDRIRGLPHESHLGLLSFSTIGLPKEFFRT
jgi:hypothetical protein